MPANLYEILAMAMRYWFALLGLLIVWRSFRWLRRDRSEQRKRLRRLPDAGTVGEFQVIVGSRELPEGALIALPWEGVLGFNRSCDVVVPCEGVAPRHLDFSFEEGVGLLLYLRHRQTVEVDGDELTARSRASQHPLLHGSTLKVGEALLRLSIFAGIDVDHHAAQRPDDPASGDFAAPMQPPDPQQMHGYPQPPYQPGYMPNPQEFPQAPYQPGYAPNPQEFPQPSYQPGYAPNPQEPPQQLYPPAPKPPVNAYPPPDPVPTDAPTRRHRRAGRRDADA